MRATIPAAPSNGHVLYKLACSQARPNIEIKAAMTKLHSVQRLTNVFALCKKS